MEVVCKLEKVGKPELTIPASLSCFTLRSMAGLYGLFLVSPRPTWDG